MILREMIVKRWLRFLIVVLLCGSVWAQLTPVVVKVAGAELDLSIRNEVDHAQRQAALYLAHEQGEDGGWGQSNRLYTTALVLCALSTVRQDEFSESRARAALWLDQSVTNKLDGEATLSAHAWRLLALTQVLAASGERREFLGNLRERGARVTAGATVEAQHFWQEALAEAGVGEMPTVSCAMSNSWRVVQERWPAVVGGSASAWRAARLINQLGEGR